MKALLHFPFVPFGVLKEGRVPPRAKAGLASVRARGHKGEWRLAFKNGRNQLARTMLANKELSVTEAVKHL